MKPRNFYLFVAVLALWMVWATAAPAFVMALAGNDDYYSVAGKPTWTPTVTLAQLGLEGDERLARANTVALMTGSFLRNRIRGRLGERLGGFHWHGPVPAVVRVVAADGGTIAFSMAPGARDAEYIEGSARDASGVTVQLDPSLDLHALKDLIGKRAAP